MGVVEEGGQGVMELARARERGVVAEVELLAAVDAARRESAERHDRQSFELGLPELEPAQHGAKHHW